MTSSIAYGYVVTHINTCEMAKERIKNERFTNERGREAEGAREKEKRKRK